MKTATIQELKSALSSAIAAAESGELIVITRHGRAVAQIGPASTPSVHRGSRAGRSRLEPALRRGTGGRYLKVLAEDRGER